MKIDRRSRSLTSAFAVFNKRKKISKLKKHLTPLPSRSLVKIHKKNLQKKKSLSTSSLKKEEERTETVNNVHISEEIQSTKEKEGNEGASSSLTDNNADAKKCFEWLIYPVKPEQFFSDLWEKKPLLVQRHRTQYYKGVFSCKEFDKILREKHIHFSKNIDITSYRNGERQTHNADGRAYAAVVWDHYQNGCSVRFLNPQTYSRSVWRLNSLLQEYFGSFVGANVYLTPPGSQGFAPHYDDIEAFILQLEGKKQWKLYSPREPAEELPRYSSGNFKQDEIGDPVLEVELEPGDMLYFPRGFIHQAKTVESIHSLHITLSTYQKNTWGDLLEKLVPRALNLAIEEDLEFRKSLPRNYMAYLGVANSAVECPEKDAFYQKAVHLMKCLVNYLPIDAAADQMAKEYVHSALPPVITDQESSCSIHGNGEFWEDNGVRNAVELDPDTEVRLIRKYAARLVMEDDGVKLYHSLENTRVYQEMEPQYVEVGAELAPAVEYLLHAFPQYVTIEELPLSMLEQKMEIAGLLYDKGLLVTKVPLTEEIEHDS